VNVFGASLRLAFAYDLSICLPSCRSRLGLRLAHKDFYSRSFDGLVTRTAAGYSYMDNWASFPGGSFIRKNGSWLRCNVNRFFIQRNPRFANDLGKSVVLGEQERREMLSTLGYWARQLDVRAIKKFGLETIEPEFKESENVPSPDGAA
jgi:hypothetical protein